MHSHIKKITNKVAYKCFAITHNAQPKLRCGYELMQMLLTFC